MMRNHNKSSVDPSAHGRQAPKQKELLHNTVVTYYLLVMFSFFTLFLTKKYSQSRHDKFYLFLLLSGILILGVCVTYCISWLDRKHASANLSPILKPLTVTDGAFLCYLIFALISTFSSAYFPGTFIAEFGRNNGMLLIFCYAAVYCIISRMYVHKDYLIAIFLLFSCVIALLTVLNFFYLDPLGLLKGYDAKTAEDFGSTIGNKNTIASYMAMFLPIAMTTLSLSQKLGLRIIAGISIVFAYAGALSSNSGSVIMGLCVALPAAAIFCAQRYDTLKRYLLALTLLFAGGKLLRLFSLTQGDRQKGFEFTQEFLIYNHLSYIPLIVCGLLALALYLLRGKLEPRYPAKAITIALISFTGVMIVGFLGAILYFSLADTTTKLGALERLLRFDDRWGTHRGFMWIRAMQEYGDFNLWQKLFGAGPDTAYYVLEPHFDELLRRFGNSSTNCVHNEYLNYLVTQGALGLLSYLVIIGSVCVRSLRRARQDPRALIFISAAICYAVQATVNIYQPITTPLFLLFLSIAEALNRQNPLQLKQS